MDHLRFCISDTNENTIKKFIVKNKNKHKLYINSKEYIIVEFCKELSFKFLKIELDDAIIFFEFVIANNLFCDCESKHNCNMLGYIVSYFDTVIENNMFDNIHFIIEILTPYLDYNDIHIDKFNNQYLWNYMSNSSNGRDFVAKLLSKSNYETIIFTIKIVQTYNLNGIFEYLAYHKRLKLFFKLLDYYEENILKFFKSKTIKPKYKINLEYLLTSVLFLIDDNKNLNIFNKIIDKTSHIIDELNILTIKQKDLKFYEKTIKSLEYSTTVTTKLMLDRLIGANENINLFEQLIKDGADTEKIEYNKILLLVKYNHINTLEILLKYHVINNTQINNLFQKCYCSNHDIIDLLVDSGADYEKYGLYVLIKARQHDNQKVIEYLEDLLNHDK
ncbi:hypothetical protein QLL95_gp0565 [Cotonvirus japonicus]|uniref:Ankyrin repeat protein n=1 Tax=Cotonvirus japonicus TaxID=2811091 RepID=A0ABM7NTQ7_9VIRU|nr:hypothetical protein QLL95_gp0565 [Cotonvirus japonicus]BCS83558.1 hypothetical protein [Cotonvirus japonicus]